MSAGVRRALLVGVAVVVVAAVAAFVVTRTEEPPGVTIAGGPFAEGDSIAGATRGVLSPDGSQLAVLSPDGLGLAVGNRIRPITDDGSRVVDVAWFPNGSTVLVAEGPVPTGLLAVVDIDGTVRGSIPLAPSVGFGDGHGMVVAPGGRRAVVTAVDRPALAAEQRRLVHVDLETGATRDLTPPGGPDETRPFFLDAERIAFVETTPGDGGGVRTVVIALADGSVLDVATGVRVVGVTDGGQPVLERSGELVIDGRRVGRVPAGTSLTSVHAGTGLGVLAESVTAADGSTTARLRRLDLARAA